MARCEDYPACGHGPVPYGDGGGCPDSEGRFDCVECQGRLPANSASSICDRCLRSLHDAGDEDFDLREGGRDEDLW